MHIHLGTTTTFYVNLTVLRRKMILMQIMSSFAVFKIGKRGHIQKIMLISLSLVLHKTIEDKYLKHEL